VPNTHIQAAIRIAAVTAAAAAGLRAETALQA
jgi:hypothetical protein